MKADHTMKICRQAFKELVEEVETGRSDTLVAYLRAMGKLRSNYSLANTILIHLQKPDATHVAGYHAWRRLGRHVKKEERGLAIMAPIVRRKKYNEEDDTPDTDQETVITFKTVYLFDISQTDGKPLSSFAKVQGDPGEYMNRLKKFVMDQGIELKYSDALGLTEGLSSGGMIILKKNLSPAEEFSVMVHELAHELLHQEQNLRPQSKTVRETEGEGVAFIVGQAIGLNLNTASCDYIQLYDGKKETLMASLDRIQKTAAMIIEAITAKEDRDVSASMEMEIPYAQVA